MSQPIVWIDIPAIDLERAIRFYSEVLGQPVRREAFEGSVLGVLTHEGGSAGGCLYVSDTDRPSAHGPLLYFNCNGRLDEALATVARVGGRVLTPKHAIAGHGQRAVVLDSEGNRIALHSN
jgi:uncharacterized protein